MMSSGKDDDEPKKGAGPPGRAGDAQHLIVIRHGDRWDYENPTAWKNHPNNRKGDPSLSSLGLAQARETGQYLDSVFKDLGISSEDITWMSSPFLRTLQTSTEALNALTLDGSNQIEILPEPGIFEWDGHGGDWHASMPEITERIHYFPRLLDSASSYDPLLVPTLPEPRSGFQDRCDTVMTEMHKRHSFRPKSTLVVVTHAAVCIGLVASASGNAYNEITPAAPCSIFHMSRWNNEPAWHLDPHDADKSKNGFTDHLSTLGRNTIPWNGFGEKENRYSGPPTSRFAPDNIKRATPDDGNCGIQ